MRTVCYVAGPISKGDLVANIRQAHEAGMALIRAGLSPIVPHGNCFWGNDVSDGAFAPSSLPAGTTLQDWYGMDLAIVARCDCVLRLPGESVGADMEAAEAGRLGLPVFNTAAEVVAWDVSRRPA